MKLRLALVCFALITFAICASVFVLGQGTDLGTIRGTVTDSSGAVVANASVTIVDLATNTPRVTSTNSTGGYQLFGLPSGAYKVDANAVLKVSTASEKVVVTAEAATINTADQTISDTLNTREVIDLPRDSRDVYSFLYLNPNITQGNDSG